MPNQTAEFRRPAVLKFVEQTGCAVDMDDYRQAISSLAMKIGKQPAISIAKAMGYSHPSYFLGI